MGTFGSRSLRLSQVEMSVKVVATVLRSEDLTEAVVDSAIELLNDAADADRGDAVPLAWERDEKH